jgi:hypothetical protein
VADIGELQDVVARDVGDGLLRACDVATQGMTRPDELFEQVLHEVLRLVLVAPQLLQDDKSLALHLVRVDNRVRDEVEEHVQSKLEML